MILSMASLSTFIGVCLKALGIVFISDLLVGFVHWLEDRYGQESWPIVGKTVIAPNLLHHDKPRAFLKNSWWASADYQCMAAAACFVISVLCGFFTWELALFLILAINGNEVHKWSHRSKKENGSIITALQRWHVIQSRAHHGRHHGGDRDTHYCSLTPWVNPLMDKFKFWRALEWCILKTTGVGPRLDPVVVARKQRHSQQIAA
ncbi:MAG: hypothetical protein HRU15_00965 [Planctomycetes bacterium]|nr:hypothetical protein [Planctomycetota bacterium]